LEQEKKEVQERLKKKETELYQYKFKIKELQKTKHVLTHRTTEMKGSLEPKEKQIENLKEQLLDLEKVFEQQSKAMNSLKEDVEKKQQKINELDREVKEEKAQTKAEEKIIQQFVNDVHKIVQDKDEKQYAKELNGLFDRYVKPCKEEILEKKNKDPDTIEELQRQLEFMRKSKAILNSNKQKNEFRTKESIKVKTSENTQLIDELQSLRMELKKLKKESREKDLRIVELKLLEKNMNYKEEEKRGSVHSKTK